MKAAGLKTGGCQCGAVRYSARGEIGYPHVCHCRMCQKAAGNYFLPLGAVKRVDFVLSRGEPAWFQSSVLVRRGFCAACGTPLFYDIPDADFINITLGSLDEPQAVKPVMQSSMTSRLHWFGELDHLPVEPASDDDQSSATIVGSNYQHPDHETDHWPLEPHS